MSRLVCRHLCYATAVLRESPECALVATNPDSGDRITADRIMPGTGCLVAALEKASDRQAVRCLRTSLSCLPRTVLGIRFQASVQAQTKMSC